MAGKPNKDFLAKPRGARKPFGSMTIDNVRDRPDLPRTDDIKVILQNFVEYYGELYKHKPICPKALDRLMGNLTLELNEEEVKELNAPIESKEMLKALVDTPKGKSPGTDRLPYECYKACPLEAASILAGLGNLVSDKGAQPNSWAQILISVLPKEADSYSTHKFRPISLLNTDYKVVMRVWANRLGPILAKKIGHHQRGFIPGRDGRENIINVQMIIDLINSKNEEGAIAFLDQEKAFDMVSFTTINTIFAKLNWPARFRSLLATVYKENHIRAKVKANGVTSDDDFAVNSGTRQGCPLSPLIYAVVADLYNMAVISHKSFKGHETLKGNFVKISAYADDTAVHLGSLADIKIYRLLLNQYSLATGGVTNFNKSEAVLCGSWRHTPPTGLGINVAKSSKYLGVITGCDPAASKKAIAEREARVYRQIDAWDHRLSSSPVDRVMVAKIMCLSLVWYHAGIVPGWDDALRRIEKRVQAFIWKGGIPKVAKHTLRLPKKEGGLSVWSLVDKANAFSTMWVVKLLQNMTNPILEATIAAAVAHYQKLRGTDVPLWESRLDHSHDIVATTGMKMLAKFQGAWSVVVRRNPTFHKGEWIAYINGLPDKINKDEFWEGRGKIVNPGFTQDDTVVTDWYSLDWNTEALKYEAPEDGEAWHLDRKCCFRLNKGWDMRAPNWVDSRPQADYT